MDLNHNQEHPISLKREEAAEILRVSVRTVDRLIEDGNLPASKVGRAVRIDRADVLALLSPSTPIAPAADLSPRTSAVGASSVSVPGAPEAPGPDPFREAS